MKKVLYSALTTVIIAGLTLCSCSPSRHLAEGEFRLAKNDVSISPDSRIPISEVSAYIKQQPAPFSITGSDPVVYKPELVDASIENIKEHLEYLGYFNSDVSSEINLKKRNVKVLYTVHPGSRYIIKNLYYELPVGGEEFRQDFYADTVNVSIHPGSYLSEAAVKAESERSAAHMRSMGYYGFSKDYYVFEADTLNGPDDVSLTMRINGYARNETAANEKSFNKFYFGDVTISHDKDLQFKEKVLRSLTTVRPGDLYNETDLNNSYSRLSSLKLFNSVGVELSQADTNLVNCAISLSESQIQGFKVNLEASTNSSGLMGVSPQLSYYHKNIFHGGEWLNLSFMGNFQFRPSDNTRANEMGISAGISLPKFLGLGYSHFKGATLPRTEINASFNYQDRPEYERTIVSSSLGYSGTTPKRLTYQIYPIQLNVVSLYNIDENFKKVLDQNPFIAYAYQDHLDAGIGGTLFYSTNTDINPKTSYHYIRYTMDLSGNLISLFAKDKIFGIPFTQYVRSELTLGRTWKLGRSEHAAVATRLLGGIGYAYGNSSALPFEKQFYGGGANSLRGWQARAVGPGNSELNEYFIIPSQTGDMKLEANIEYRFGLFWKLNGAVFIDAGNVWTLNESTYKFSPRTIAADWGLGLRCDLNFIVVRIDAGFKMHDPSRQAGFRWLRPDEWVGKDGYAIHFGVGYPF